MACRFSTCLQQWPGKEGGYSWNSPTCAWRWICPKWQKKAFLVLQWWKRNISVRDHLLKSEKRRSGVLSFLGITRWRLRYKDTWQCLIKIKRPATFIAKMARQSICRHAGDRKEQINLHPPDAKCGLRSWLHISAAWHRPHLPQPVTLPELNLLKLSICRPDIGIHRQLFPMKHFLQMLRIPSTIPILI